MRSYEIYLTKSNAAATLISEALRGRAEKEGYLSTSVGIVNQNCKLPTVYNGKGYYYAMAEYDSDSPKYELIIC